MTTFDQFAELARSRRTSLLIDRDRMVDSNLIEDLCEVAGWAPSHKKIWPWRFACFTGDGRARLGETMVRDMVEADLGDDVKREKTRSKYLAVGCAPHPNEMLHLENRDAVAAAIQNLLLGATAMGLASFWSTPALTSPARVLDLCGFDPADRLVGVLYLGWPDGTCAAPARPRTPVSRIDS
jgi:nitroreductase